MLSAVAISRWWRARRHQSALSSNAEAWKAQLAAGAGLGGDLLSATDRQDDWGLTASRPIQCQDETRASRQVVLIELAADVVAEISGER